MRLSTPVMGPATAPKERPSELSPGTMRKILSTFMSAKVQSEEDRNANAKRSGFPFQNLIVGTRSSVPRRSFRSRSGQWTPVGEPSRVGGRYGDCNRKSDDGCGTPSRCRYVPVTRIPPAATRTAAPNISRHGGASGTGKALANFKGAGTQVGPDSRVSEAHQSNHSWERSPGHRRKIETNMSIRAKHRERP